MSTNSYHERLNRFKTEINSASLKSRELKSQVKKAKSDREHNKNWANWKSMIDFVWALESNTKEINALLAERLVLKNEARDFWMRKNGYNETNVNTE